MNRYNGHTPGEWDWADNDILATDPDDHICDAVLYITRTIPVYSGDPAIYCSPADRLLIADAPKILTQRDKLLKIVKRIKIQEHDDGWWLWVKGSQGGAVPLPEPHGIVRSAFDDFEAERRAAIEEVEES